MKRIFSFALLVSIMLLLTINANSQTLLIDENGVSINEDESAPDITAILDVKSSEKGILVPRMTTVQVDAIVSPALGLLVFDTDVDKFKYYNGNIWKNISDNVEIEKGVTEGNFLIWDATNEKWKVGSELFEVNGDLGIGTNTPDTKLHVYNDTPGEFATKFQTPGGQIEIGCANSGYAHFYTDRTWFFFNKGLYIETGVIAANVNDNLTFKAGPSGQVADRLTILTDGNVGVGTITPTEKLEVAGNVKADSYLLSNGSTLTSGKFVDGTIAEDAVFTGGKVGIGTSAPTTSLDVNNPTGGEYVAKFQSPYGYINMGALNSSYSHISTDRPWIYFNKSLSLGNGVLSSYTNRNLELRASNKRSFIIMYDTEYIGMGTLSPTERLEVTGNVKADSYLLADGSVVKSASTDQGENFGVGSGALVDNQGKWNFGLGEKALNSNRTGEYNVALGFHAGATVQSGSKNVFIGHQAGFNETGSNMLYIAHNADNPLIKGDFDDRTLGIGIDNSRSYTLNVGGEANATKWLSNSDLRWKKDIAEISGAVNMVKQMRGVRYDWRIGEFPNKAFSEGREVGLIAQEVEAVVPEVVYTDHEGYKSIAYDKLVSVLLQAIKEQQVVIEQLQTEVQEIKNTLE